MTADLFDELPVAVSRETLAPGAMLLRSFAREDAAALLQAVAEVTSQSLFRHLVTPGGRTMSVAMSNCGALGWVSDRSGYRYDARDPLSGQPWPAMPAILRKLAVRAAAQAGFAHFEPDACLVNRYEPGARLSLHQDRDEQDFFAPIVSVSLGLPAVFLFGTPSRKDRPQRHRLQHGDVVVWGGPSRLAFHGVAPLADGEHTLLGRRRINLTFRRVG
ncbi:MULTISPECIES: DNA oxidative demethylase AlkB [unclassified Polaromonas]|uniref:DNA oxidative demethylase AlkB n=1 Tax=unclassified Polaromonas TaxID=2638319 RepID=UPI000BDB8BB7|nr:MULTISPECIES: DNA oxidative demethylase AlkB [unclassified Polaromonas]OYY36941.1 MAG: alpha-ketoglutarate-dependent dioxygenase AlkB [Polaromonas sp. 35-63-35]OYZ20561.1 MAG: alpha-ketoglutarate-dependent dioxygenase AlkB [Polaromonas sp. 16-63-31]OYZ78701.1 MAG: alpha-ketoglutarate-dependent dioxygenase AlkB [Polaromonas sp. 24-63-21]OZA49787.1 MAG: alpha-ketoglutarate-dependent dioxygenase AlkB [Polaromonas sp. 17-63-33]OZA89044.1 MAG: alpha-ketoglutarate-dependent dioxygenase AlkB [Pola